MKYENICGMFYIDGHYKFKLLFSGIIWTHKILLLS